MNTDKLYLLSVDDEPSFTDLIKQYFEPRGYYVDIACEGTLGLELLKEKKYDVVLMDLKMVGMNGDEVLRELNKNKKKGIKVIFITAYSDGGKTRERLIGEGAYEVMEKPITSLKRLEDVILEAAKSSIKEG